MEDLIKRLEAAEVGSRELDLRVFEKFDLVDGERWSDADLEYALTDPDRTINPPRLSQSLDAALALADRVLPGWAWMVRYWPEDQGSGVAGWTAYVRETDRDLVDSGPVFSTPALALCIAILRAKMENEK